MRSDRWKQRPPGSNWGDFGPDDQRGRMNWVTPEKVLEGVAEVREGITFCLSLPLDHPGGNVLNPRRLPPRLAATYREPPGHRSAVSAPQGETGSLGRPGASRERTGQQNFCWQLSGIDARLTDVVCDDVVLLTLQYSTQWDSFAHIGSRFDADGDGTPEIVFYNGFRGGEHVRPAQEREGAESWARFEGTRADALGIEQLAAHGAQGRGVMVDLFAHYGRERRAIGYDALMRVLEADRVVVEKGDFVCFHTGFAELILEMAMQPDPHLLHHTCTGLDGRDAKLLRWVSDSGCAALVADNYAVEIIPEGAFAPVPHALMPLHEHCIFKNGIHLGELWYLSDLARWLRERGRNRFLLTAPPLRLPGAVGSPATPIATV